MWICKKCESRNEDMDRFCVVCGAEKIAFVEPVVEPPVHREPAGTPGRYANPQVVRAAEPTITAKKPSDAAILQEKYDDLTRTANFFKASIILCVIIALVLAAQPYLKSYSSYTIYNLAMGLIGSIEQVCSIVLLVFAILPAIFILISFDSRKRNLPVTISWVTLFATAIYCGFIYFGNSDRNVVPLLIVMCYALCVFFATMYVKKLIERENVLFKKGGFDTPRKPESQPMAPAREEFRPMAEKGFEPARSAQVEQSKSRLKSTMR